MSVTTQRILVVDDELTNLKLLDKLLKTQGYSDLELIQDPRDVLGSYHRQRPNLILLDLNMPHLDGFAVMAQLMALNDPLLPPVIILTAQNSRDYLMKALEAGARDYITKPFDIYELQMRVKNLLDAQSSLIFMHEQKSILEEMVREKTKELTHTRLQVVQRLGRAAEYRDEETGNHILRMSHYSKIIAQAIGWSDAQCDLVLNASPMHDIGKIGIPDDILLKPGKLEADEWAIMQAHTTIGAELLDGDDSDLMLMAREISLTHHEKWDGSGYPGGLAGEDIPLSGRITALADVFDALTSSRPYKRAWSFDDATDYIVENKGRHFDPLVADAFLEQLPEIGKIQSKFSKDS